MSTQMCFFTFSEGATTTGPTYESSTARPTSESSTARPTSENSTARPTSESSAETTLKTPSESSTDKTINVVTCRSINESNSKHVYCFIFSNIMVVYVIMHFSFFKSKQYL